MIRTPESYPPEVPTPRYKTGPVEVVFCIVFASLIWAFAWLLRL